MDFDRDRAQTETIGRTASPCVYRCTIISDARRLRRLERAWRALHRAANSPYLSDSFEWAWLSWNLVGAPRGRRLSCAVVWRRSRVVAILPLAVSRRGFWRLARPLTSESTEYCPYLIGRSARPSEVFEAMLSALRHAEVDALRLNWVREEGALGRWLAMRSDAVRTFTLPSTEVRFKAFGEWNRYRAQLGRRMRTHLHRARQRATKLGDLAVVEVTEPGERAAVWRWMIHHKRRWLAQRDLQSHWLAAPEYERFMLKSLEVFGPERMRIFTLKLNGALIAADLCNIDGARLEQFFNVFDDNYSHIGPGNLLREYCTEWAFARGLDYDLRPGRQPYKQEWASQVGAVSDYTVPLTWLGRRFLFSMRAYNWLARKIPRAWRPLASASAALDPPQGQLWTAQADAGVYRPPPGRPRARTALSLDPRLRGDERVICADNLRSGASQPKRHPLLLYIGEQPLAAPSSRQRRQIPKRRYRPRLRPRAESRCRALQPSAIFRKASRSVGAVALAARVSASSALNRYSSARFMESSADVSNVRSSVRRQYVRFQANCGRIANARNRPRAARHLHHRRNRSVAKSRRDYLGSTNVATSLSRKELTSEPTPEAKR